jgi:hypothetical protein
MAIEPCTSAAKDDRLRGAQPGRVWLPAGVTLIDRSTDRPIVRLAA